MSWILKNEEKYTLYTPSSLNISSFEKSLSSFPLDTNKVVDCSSLLLTPTAIDLLVKAYDLHASHCISFVVVISADDDFNALEEYFIIVPTVSEAIEYIYMEELEKTL
tara:strand:+ start:923 stop:1246 length:324 start_codon:yes stop_codon:yes gene_type:complete